MTTSITFDANYWNENGLTEQQRVALDAVAAAGDAGLAVGGADYQGGRVAINGNAAYRLEGFVRSGVRAPVLIEARYHGSIGTRKRRGRLVEISDVRWHLTDAGRALL